MARKTYVKFVERVSKTPRRVVEVQTLRGETLGGITWYASWCQYVFVPDFGCVFSHDCMEDIAVQVVELNGVKHGA